MSILEYDVFKFLDIEFIVGEDLEYVCEDTDSVQVSHTQLVKVVHAALLVDAVLDVDCTSGSELLNDAYCFIPDGLFSLLSGGTNVVSAHHVSVSGNGVVECTVLASWLSLVDVSAVPELRVLVQVSEEVLFVDD